MLEVLSQATRAGGFAISVAVAAPGRLVSGDIIMGSQEAVRSLHDRARQGAHAEAGTLMFLRIAEHYEAFFEDAERVSDELTLPIGTRFGGDAPVVCIDRHVAEDCFERLLEAGHALAIIEHITLSNGASRDFVRHLRRGSVASLRVR
jgi:hypothetical protein